MVSSEPSSASEPPSVEAPLDATKVISSGTQNGNLTQIVTSAGDATFVKTPAKVLPVPNTSAPPSRQPLNQQMSTDTYEVSFQIYFYFSKIFI